MENLQIIHMGDGGIYLASVQEIHCLEKEGEMVDIEGEKLWPEYGEFY